ncbi:hypothetical protein BH20ACT9_BH20ACT9_20710 [soil metagenome]
MPRRRGRTGRQSIALRSHAAPKLERVTGHDDYIVGDPEDLMHRDWADERRP